MASKSSPVAYVPLTKTTETVATAPTKIDTPDYPDVGVAYAGYSKKLSSGNTYRLSVQEPFEQQASFLWTASNTLLTLNVLNKTGKTIYLSKITASFFTDTNNHVTIYMYNSGTDYKSIGVLACRATNTVSCIIDFPAPIPVTKLQWGAAPVGAMTGRISLNFTGWYEDNL